jgi:hypothetical protein
MIGNLGQKNLFIMLSKNKKNYFQEYILQYIINNFKKYGIIYEIILCNEFKNDNEFTNIKIDDYILWEPITAFWNIDYVNSHVNSIIILKNPTILIQKISNKNPINESLAIINGFRILYMDPEDMDVTNEEWRLVIGAVNYSITIEKLRKIIKPNLSEKLEIEMYKTMRNSNIGENQINLE